MLIDQTVLSHLIYEKNVNVVRFIETLSVKDKRKVFAIMRRNNIEGLNYLFENFQCMTLGEFCTSQVILNDNKRRKD